MLERTQFLWPRQHRILHGWLNAEVLSEKVVMFSESQCATYCKVLAGGVLIYSYMPNIRVSA